MIMIICPKCKSKDLFVVNEIKTECGQYSVEINCGNCNWEKKIIRHKDNLDWLIYIEK